MADPAAGRSQHRAPRAALAGTHMGPVSSVLREGKTVLISGVVEISPHPVRIEKAASLTSGVAPGYRRTPRRRVGPQGGGIRFTSRPDSHVSAARPS